MCCFNTNTLRESRSVGVSETYICGNTIKHAKRSRPAAQEAFLLQGVEAKLGESPQVQTRAKGEGGKQTNFYCMTSSFT